MSTNTKFLKEYSWPVPIVFKDALEFMTLAQGDVFYSHPDAYSKEWGDALRNLQTSIQVMASFPIGPKVAFYESNSRKSASEKIREEVISYDELRAHISSWPPIPSLKSKFMEDFLKRWNKETLKEGDALYERSEPYEKGEAGLEFALKNSWKAIEVIIPFEFELEIAIFRPNQKKTALEQIGKKTLYYYELRQLLKCEPDELEGATLLAL